MSRLPALALTALVALNLSCRFLRSDDEAEAPRFPAPDRPMPAVTMPTPVPPPVPDGPLIEMTAQGQLNTLHFTIVNNATNDLYVGPQNLALIMPGDQAREVLRATDEHVLCRFRPVVLTMGGSAAGEIVFLSVDDVVGRRLVFNSNQLTPSLWMADVVPEPAAGETPPAPQ